MEKRFESIIRLALRHRATDIHFSLSDEGISIQIRGIDGLLKLKTDREDEKLFNYLKYQAHIDLSSLNRPQVGAFTYFLDGMFYDFRLAVITTARVRNGVLRILNCHGGMPLAEITADREAQKTFLSWLNKRSGLIIFSGLTGSGKTTTLYSLLKQARNRMVYSLEDPIEVVHDNIIQLEVNERIGFGYDEGIKQILRHNPDIVMIGEIRDEKTAKMAVRAALTGCLVVTSLHARSTTSAINRLVELGVNRHDLLDCLEAVVSQRLCKVRNDNRYTCIFDILTRSEIKAVEQQDGDARLKAKVLKAVESGLIEERYRHE